jgi:cell division protein FtsW
LRRSKERDALKAKTGKKPVDYIVFISVFILLSFGIIIVFSASWPYAHNEYNDVYYILKRQLLFALIGFVTMFLAANYDYRKLEKFAPYLMALSLALLVLVLIPGIGRPTNDVWRWLYIGPFQLQPSEVAKAAVILFFAHSLSKRRDDLKYFFKGFVPYLVLIGIISVLLLKEPHLSCTIIIILLASVMLFCAGARVFHFMIVSVPAVAGLSVIVATVPYMQARIQAFIDPWKDLAGDGWQVVQSLYAIGSGGLFGRGLGKSMQKFMYLPEPHNDFIFPILAEELGFIGVFTVLFMFGVFIWRGIRIAVNAPDMFGSLLAIGITSLIAIQSLLNVATVTASVPPTGVSLPFFSSGGTSLIMFMTEVGVLMNISRYSQHHRRI